MDVNFLLDRCKDETGASTDGELAKRLGVSKQAMSSYRKGARLPDPVVCATIAGLSGLPLAKVLGIVGEARAISREEKAVWRKLAGMTAAILLFVGSAIGTHAKASNFDAISQVQMHAQNSSSVYIMRNRMAQAKAAALRRLRWIWLWITSCLPQRPPSDTEIEA